jgi:hypothetical protein
MTKRVASVTIISYLVLGLSLIHYLGNRYADKMMEILKANPSPDLYANDHGFQYVAFWYTQGLGWLILLLITAFLLGKYLGSSSGSDT